MAVNRRACEHPYETVTLYIKRWGLGRLAGRGGRLFMAACCRLLWGRLVSPASRRAVETTELVADRPALAESLRTVLGEADDAIYELNHLPEGDARIHAAYAVCHGVKEDVTINRLTDTILDVAATGEEAKSAVALLLSEVVGDPARPVVFKQPWHTVDVFSLAEAAYRERLLPSGHLDTDRLAVLSDALEETGCTDASILAHLRSPGPHVRGCWALDLVLGRW